MDTKEFRRRGKEMVDYIADYYDTIRDRKVVHDVRPGYMKDLVPKNPPEDGESWDDIFADIERVVMPGVTHWRSPRFHGYYAAGGSFPSLMGDMLCDAIGCIGFSWAASPACTELEMLTTDWLGRMIGLPSQFLHESEGSGGGVIQSTASETVFLTVLAARNRKIEEVKKLFPDMTTPEITSKLVCYSSDQANSSVHRSGLLAEVRMRHLESDDKFRLRGDVLRKAFKEDKAEGLIPFFLCATLGTTGACSFDNISELGPICKEENVWLHIDAAYAGAAFICPEYRHLLKGVEYAETFSMNPHKWLLTNFDLSVMWIQHREHLVDAFNVDPIYLRHQNEGKIPDYRHWQIPLGRRFRSLKLWFVIRSYGVSGIQKYIRTHVERACQFEQLLRQDGRFEIPIEVIMGLVCFKLKGPNRLTEMLHNEIISDGKIYLIPAYARAYNEDIYFLRLAVVPEDITPEDIKLSFQIISDCATKVLTTNNNNVTCEDYRPKINIDALPGTTFDEEDSLTDVTSSTATADNHKSNANDVSISNGHVTNNGSTNHINRSKDNSLLKETTEQNHLVCNGKRKKIV